MASQISVDGARVQRDSCCATSCKLLVQLIGMQHVCQLALPIVADVVVLAAVFQVVPEDPIRLGGKLVTAAGITRQSYIRFMR